MKVSVACLIATNLVLAPLVARAEGRQDFFAELAKTSTIQLGNKETEVKRKNGPAIVQFWASWCVGCRVGMEKTIQKTGAAPGETSGGPSPRFISVSMDEDPSAARKYLERSGEMATTLIEATVVDTSQKLAEKLQVKAVPTMLFVHADGSIAGRIVGHGSPAEFDRLSKLISQGH